MRKLAFRKHGSGHNCNGEIALVPGKNGYLWFEARGGTHTGWLSGPATLRKLAVAILQEHGVGRHGSELQQMLREEKIEDG